MAQAIKNVIVIDNQKGVVDDVKQAGNSGIELKEHVHDIKNVSHEPEDYIIGKTCCDFHANETGYIAQHYIPINIPKIGLHTLSHNEIVRMIEEKSTISIMVQCCTSYNKSLYTFCKLIDVNKHSTGGFITECYCCIDVDNITAYVYNQVDWMVYNNNFTNNQKAQAIKNVIVIDNQKEDETVDVKQAGNVGAELKEIVNYNQKEDETVDVKQVGNVGAELKEDETVDVKQVGNVGAELKEVVNYNKVVAQEPEDYIVGETCCHYHANKTGNQVKHYNLYNPDKLAYMTSIHTMSHYDIYDMMKKKGGVLNIMMQTCACYDEETFTFHKLIDIDNNLGYKNTMLDFPFISDCGCSISIGGSLVYIYDPVDWFVYKNSIST
jgi:hypothetical protein